MCRRASEGSTNRVRLKIDRFLNQTIPLPPREHQRRILDQISSQLRRVEEAEAQLEACRAELQETLRETA